MKLKKFIALSLLTAITCFTQTNAQAQPTNDARASATTISGFVTVAGTNIDATRETGDPARVNYHSDPSGTVVGTPTVWYRWTPTQSGSARIEALAVANIDPQLGVYAPGDLTELGSNE